MNKFKQILLVPVLFFLRIYVEAKWSPWNPWMVARLNLARNRYLETTMYRDRAVEFGDEWAMKHYEDNTEALFFVSRLTLREKLKSIFVPFSCGDYYRMPWWQIRFWLFGVEED